MAIKSITQRWIVNSLSVILVAIIFIAIAFSFAMKNFYYAGVKQSIEFRSTQVRKALNNMRNDDVVNFNATVRDFVENSEDKNIMEITAIDYDGRVAVSSSGFSYNQKEKMPDYEDAKVSSTRTGYRVLKTAGGERVTAVTIMIPYTNSEYSAIRYVVSMEQVDKILFLYMLVFLAVAIIILTFVMISGFYFIKSIVIPVRDVGSAARRFATGDMSARIIKKSDDELGELCDIINYMADEISASEEMKNEFISSVSHELRTPLTAIKGWSETLMTLEGDDKITMQKGMRVITSETERLSIMVEELLDFSRIQNGRLTLVKTTIDILAELGEAVMIYTERARRDKIELIYNEPEMVSFVFGDKNRLRQVFINVIDNALKYSDAGDTVTIDVIENSGVLHIIVADTGCGISSVDLPKVKTKFYKANLTRRGSGIGLAVANEIVMMHDGEIDIQSELNVGTTVIIKLPVNLKKGEQRKTEISTTMEFNLNDDTKKA
ncbi:HAMP domain-containing sensor histidine kinase [Paludicola sp. MB14-C6]|uniref:sensor histidine kinase n=1 Tax=Paludihabitans sp. MB14-C6 TaxID=3070656 RepID=UPI0027DB18DF|nr:HAMP domain-containing sensor histidine kinase [Paludicola sp. MB14-C6]WMJ22448.1 HAMP domain-containing sensor histidine kinase [Paludicola sp. MB14-C6]